MSNRKKKTKKQEDIRPLQSAWILSHVKEASALRSGEREFHGLEREFINHQEEVLRQFEQSKDLKHPRDLGNAREVILRSFLKLSGYMPKKYGISETSARVISPSGHTSNEMDIVIYDDANAISLMSRQGVYEAFPIECVYGVIQVKSYLTKLEIARGLKNIASFKDLKTSNTTTEFQHSGFGLLFAYDSEMEWGDILKEIEKYAKSAANTSWCNAIIILNKGIIWHGNKSQAVYKNNEIEHITELVMHGRPDHQNSCLYSFYSILRDLLSGTKTSIVDFGYYHRLPLTAGKYSYQFEFGFIAEVSICEKHETYQKKLSEGNITKVLDGIKDMEPINWIKALDIGAGLAGDDNEKYDRQPNDVFIYNPEKLPFANILYAGGKVGTPLAFDSIICEGKRIWIPNHYSEKERLFEPCPKCKRTVKSKKGEDAS